MAVGNIASQGLSIATGLQKGFDWRGVATSAASGFVSAAAGEWSKSAEWGAVGQSVARSLAGGLASAAVRGGSVGRSLPKIIGDAIGGALTVGNAAANLQKEANRLLVVQRELGEQGPEYLRPGLKAAGVPDADADQVIASKELLQLAKAAQILSTAQERYGQPVDRLTQEQQATLLGAIHDQKQLYPWLLNTGGAQNGAEAASDASVEVNPNVVELPRASPIAATMEEPTLVESAASVLDIGAKATHRLVQTVGGEEMAGALLFAVQAAISGVPKTVFQLVIGEALKTPKAYLTEKVSVLLQEKVFNETGSPDAVKSISDALGGFAVDAAFDAGGGMVRNAGNYVTSQARLGPTTSGTPYTSLARPHASTPSGIIFGELDGLGRPTGVSAVIRQEMLKSGTSANPTIRPPGFEGQAGNHARGHLLANVLGGSGDDARNLVTLFQRNANHPNMSSFERQVRGAVEGGETVSFRAIPIYAGSNAVPTGISLTARGSNGFNLDVSVPNSNGVR
jgi:hypothetical protein